MPAMIIKEESRASNINQVVILVLYWLQFGVDGTTCAADLVPDVWCLTWHGPVVQPDLHFGHQVVETKCQTLR